MGRQRRPGCLSERRTDGTVRALSGVCLLQEGSPARQHEAPPAPPRGFCPWHLEPPPRGLQPLRVVSHWLKKLVQEVEATWVPTDGKTHQERWCTHMLEYQPGWKEGADTCCRAHRPEDVMLSRGARHGTSQTTPLGGAQRAVQARRWWAPGAGAGKGPAVQSSF